MLGAEESNQRGTSVSPQFRLALRGLHRPARGWSVGTDHRVERRLVKVHSQAPAPSAEQVRLSPPPPPIIEHAQSKMYRADQAEQTAVPMSLIAWTGSGEGTPTVVFLLRLLQEQISCDS